MSGLARKYIRVERKALQSIQQELASWIESLSREEKNRLRERINEALLQEADQTPETSIDAGIIFVKTCQKVKQEKEASG